MHAKAQYLVSQLQVLGFADWRCAAAVMQHGSDLEACITFLLEEHLLSEEHCKQYMALHALAPPIDLSEELRMLADAQVMLTECCSLSDKCRHCKCTLVHFQQHFNNQLGACGIWVANSEEDESWRVCTGLLREEESSNSATMSDVLLKGRSSMVACRNFWGCQ